MSEKSDRKELRQPDEFQVVAGRAMEWMVERKNLLLGGVGALVVAALALWGASAYSASREAKAGGALGEALEIASRPVAGDPIVPGTETFATREARSAALQAALEKVRSDSPGSQAAHTAAAQLGFLKLKAGDAAGAAALLTEYLDKAAKDEPLRAVALEALGSAQENQGKLDDAKATYARLAEAGAPARAAFQQARLQLVQGKPEGRAELEKVAKEYPKDPVAHEAQTRLELASLPPPPLPGSQPAPEAKPADAPVPAKAAPAKGKAHAKKG